MYYQMAGVTPGNQPTVFLSPSVQEFNPFITGENEEYWMNRISTGLKHRIWPQ